MTTQPEALSLADELDSEFVQGRISNHSGRKAAAELRRLHAENEALRVALEQPGVEPVAWRYQDSRGHYRYCGYKPGFDKEHPLLKPILLCTAPQPAQKPAALCDCKGRFYDRCESAWEPCCTLGKSAEHAVAVSNITTTTQQPEADKLLRQALEALEKSIVFANHMGVGGWQETAMACHRARDVIRKHLGEE